jgi:hypothetical protein
VLVIIRALCEEVYQMLNFLLFELAPVGALDQRLCIPILEEPWLTDGACISIANNNLDYLINYLQHVTVEHLIDSSTKEIVTQLVLYLIKPQ